MNLIEAQDICISFGPKKVISNFTYSFSSGCYALIGPNGCGKSSLLKVLAGITQNYQGQLKLKEKNQYNHLRTFLPDIPKFYPFIKVSEFIDLVCKIRKIDAEKYIFRFVEKFKIDDFLHQPLHSLSLGQTKRVFCVVTLIDESPIWILDEPSNGLDAKSKETLIESIKFHSEKNLVILSEHNREVIDQIGGVKIISLV